jgi:NAD(P)-dependent dehydrogenase (short-subunit alcohol dehydrogenase family)
VAPTDVTREEDVLELGRRALERFGRIDVWFNNAGVGIFGRFEDLPTDAWRRVIETNVLGYVHGAKVAMRQFRHQGRGVLVQNASIVGRTSKADSTAYATSKFAVRGFSEALRMEVLDQPHIHICTVLPSVIDTPFFEHAANFSRHKVRAMLPVYAPEKVAEVVVGLVSSGPGPRWWSRGCWQGHDGAEAPLGSPRHPARRPRHELRLPRRRAEAADHGRAVRADAGRDAGHQRLAQGTEQRRRAAGGAGAGGAAARPARVAPPA